MEYKRYLTPFGRPRRAESGAKKVGALKGIFAVAIFIPKLLIKVPIGILFGLWQLLAFFGLMMRATYKKFCPLVELP